MRRHIDHSLLNLSVQVILRWLIQRDIVCIPKSVTPSRIKENFEVRGRIHTLRNSML